MIVKSQRSAVSPNNTNIIKAFGTDNTMETLLSQEDSKFV